MDTISTDGNLAVMRGPPPIVAIREIREPEFDDLRQLHDWFKGEKWPLEERILVAHAGGELVGAVSLGKYAVHAFKTDAPFHKKHVTNGWIRRLTVRGDQTGRGLAKQLVRAAIDLARSMGRDEVMAGVGIWSHPAAHHVFRGLEFKPQGRCTCVDVKKAWGCTGTLYRLAL